MLLYSAGIIMAILGLFSPTGMDMKFFLGAVICYGGQRILEELGDR